MKKFKRMLTFLVALVAVSNVRAEGLGDYVKATLLDHVTTVAQFKSGETNLALMDSVIQIGAYKKQSILDLQLGFSGETAPDPGEATGMSYLAGAYLKLSSFLKDKINFAPHWTFLHSLEYGPVYVYDFREKKDFGGFQVGLAFSLNPKE